MVGYNVAMKRVGELLKEERLRQGKTLKEVSVTTKIREYFLQAIEDGSYDRLPDVIYIKGFIQGYSQALGLDSQKVMPFYRREFTEKEVDVISKNGLSSSIGPWLTVTPGKVIALVIATSLTGFLAILFLQYQQFSGAPILIIDSPIDLLETTQDIVRVSGKTSIGALLTLNGETVIVSSDGSFEQLYTLEPGLNKLRLVATNTLGKSVTENRAVDKVPASVLTPEASP
ncbi:hypothetical protein CO180_02190 [candidate division WWE3 bacterium CG_4_9_14_3_um_filter_41_6]|uniref:HTH cro/C1-type domain-containing protein n=1 Tax=candidate division WWE3 bacterium CG_4_10_14_0_2_um_filter_41_14 TaxID=1975072 RepID=A0A2M7TJY4_UNCKA|nr:MAG: hypothetical protein COY32_02390 [candidate division WWE3 bacterium CG_4_10_14_0_2_um_filter_41_14]PJA38879.1 MAG: hypothetical protein CO180_02190 [candidate division WWE3 bacterium CG_4_9_14_3_um_filter_41_6]